MSWLIQTVVCSLCCAVGVYGLGDAQGAQEVAQQPLNGSVALYPELSENEAILLALLTLHKYEA